MLVFIVTCEWSCKFTIIIKSSLDNFFFVIISLDEFSEALRTSIFMLVCEPINVSSKSTSWATSPSAKSRYDDFICLIDKDCYIDISDLSDGEHSVVVNYSLPEGVRIFTPLSVNVTITKIEEEPTPTPEEEPTEEPTEAPTEAPPQSD